MGRKTRQQKIRAEKHRQETAQLERPLLSSVPASANLDHEGPTEITGYHLPSLPSEKPRGVTSPQYDLQAMALADIKRIMSLSAVAICAQLVLWYLLAKGIVKLF